ncbi:hypothetical protein [Nocardia fusca]|uniref:hypothetical protein n=1 Tax=Nocardia fusca TaxID=941183 RepID=UPI0012F4F6A8|nr:hypothetical protein [Nocardia fusca]
MTWTPAHAIMSLELGPDLKFLARVTPTIGDPSLATGKSYAAASVASGSLRGGRR